MRSSPDPLISARWRGGLRATRALESLWGAIGRSVWTHTGIDRTYDGALGSSNPIGADSSFRRAALVAALSSVALHAHDMRHQHPHRITTATGAQRG